MTDPNTASLYARHIEVLQARARIALERGGFEHLVVPSGNPHYQVFDDRDYPYAVNPQFKAWVPLTRNPGSWLVVTPGRRPKLIYLQPRDYWHVVPEAPVGWWVEHFDVAVVRTAEEAIPHLPPAARCAILGEPQGVRAEYAPNNPAAVVAYLEYHRAFKTPYEIAMMREASRIGAHAHRAAEAAFRHGLSEFDIHLAYCAAARQDANDLPYGNIVALNEHGAVLHYTQLDREAPAASRSFLIDAGASYAGYACDITRTYSARDDDFQAMVDAVDAAQQRMCAQVRSGVDYRRIHLDAHLALAGILRDHGVLKVSAEAAVESGVSSTFFPHGVGHGIGLQVHDVAGFAAADAGTATLAKPDGHPYLRLTRTIAPGMVVTIEPGIYFIDMLLDDLRAGPNAASVDWARVAAFRPYGGIRIEDDVVCTESEPLNLTREAFARP
ncbi:Xaa-Pro dipeptidase [Cognatilysobacter lacus]|uniref:Xaa-Pro dipeptidase n=1 Tax=Cognatilysobacter lacus TaxID=1643323 RepID=A0A5D8Z892_9GAMM|nr:Xaa-Pro dipeptidase [Lysobacter lacus]TZF90303.1 Xaa-Pro dipeptidase [Lysobacter lacus]